MPCYKGELIYHMHKLWNVQFELVCAHWHLVVSNCMYESTEGRWSGNESVLAANWETIFMQGNSDILAKMCPSIQEGVWKILFGAVGQYPEW